MNKTDNIEILFKLSRIKTYKAHGSQLVSYFIPCNTLKPTAMGFLRSEIAQTEKIKTKVIKNNVTAALSRIVKWLDSNYDQGHIGLAIFSGTIIEKNNEKDILEYLYFPNNISLYKCANNFYIDPIERVLDESENFGLIVIERSECTYGYFNGREVKHINTVESDVRGKHRAGGQSSQRYERGIEHSLEDFLHRMGDEIRNEFGNRGIKKCFLGGPILTKEEFNDKKFIKELYPVEALVNLNNSGIRGLNELTKKAIPLIENTKYLQTINYFEKFIDTFERNDLYGFGLRDLLMYLNMRRIDSVLIDAENTFVVQIGTCSNCGKITYFEGDNSRCYLCDNSLSDIQELDLNNVLVILKKSDNFTLLILERSSEYSLALTNTFKGCIFIIKN